jgi:type VI protein secretion system component Hcp
MTMGPGGSSEGVNGIFLSLEGVPGESAIEAHRNWIDVLSFNYGIQNPAPIPASGSGMRAGLPQFGDLVITKGQELGEFKTGWDLAANRA